MSRPPTAPKRRMPWVVPLRTSIVRAAVSLIRRVLTSMVPVAAMVMLPVGVVGLLATR